MNVNFEQAASAVQTLGITNTILLRGQPGIGKSAMHQTLARRMPDYTPIYIDVATLDLGDLGAPVIDKDQMVTRFAPSNRFGLSKTNARPLLIMLDELGKPSSKAVLNMLLPLILERRLADVPLPNGSIVFGTTNLDTDGVGDKIPAHAYNRMTVVNMRNPTAEEWVNNWAEDAGIDPTIQAFARRYPEAFDCYTDLSDKEHNPYIFDPRVGNIKAFCTPRSLAKASNIMTNRTVLGEAYLPLLAGTVGEAAARAIDAMASTADKLPLFETIVSNPMGAKTTNEPGALFVLAMMLRSRIKDDEQMTACMQYMGRIKEISFEAYSLFIMSLASSKSKVGMACKNREFTTAAAEMGKYF